MTVQRRHPARNQRSTRRSNLRPMCRTPPSSRHHPRPPRRRPTTPPTHSLLARWRSNSSTASSSRWSPKSMQRQLESLVPDEARPPARRRRDGDVHPCLEVVLGHRRRRCLAGTGALRHAVGHHHRPRRSAHVPRLPRPLRAPDRLPLSGQFRHGQSGLPGSRIGLRRADRVGDDADGSTRPWDMDGLDRRP